MRKHQSISVPLKSPEPSLYFVVSAGDRKVYLTESDFITAINFSGHSPIALLELLRLMTKTSGEQNQ